MYLNNIHLNTDEDVRKIYVGITRAKQMLSIHVNNNIFDDCNLDNVSISENRNDYKEPNELVKQLSYKDVYLDFFIEKKKSILRLHSGTRLFSVASRLCINQEENIIPIVQFSKKLREEIEKLKSKGYILYDAKIRYIVAWQKKDNEHDSENNSEYAVVLPDIYFRKTEKQ